MIFEKAPRRMVMVGMPKMSRAVKNPRNERIGTWPAQNFWNFKNRSSLTKVTAPRRPSSFGNFREIPRFSSSFSLIFLQKLSSTIGLSLFIANLWRKVFWKFSSGVWTVCSGNWYAIIKIKTIWWKLFRFSIFTFFRFWGAFFGAGVEKMLQNKSKI